VIGERSPQFTPLCYEAQRFKLTWWRFCASLPSAIRLWLNPLLSVVMCVDVMALLAGSVESFKLTELVGGVEAVFSAAHLGQPRKFGFTRLSDNDCIDMRLRRRPFGGRGRVI
jgi:hypothetical protein